MGKYIVFQINSLPNNKILAWSKLKADNKIGVLKNDDFPP